MDYATQLLIQVACGLYIIEQIRSFFVRYHMKMEAKKRKADFEAERLRMEQNLQARATSPQHPPPPGGLTDFMGMGGEVPPFMFHQSPGPMGALAYLPFAEAMKNGICQYCGVPIKEGDDPQVDTEEGVLICDVCIRSRPPITSEKEDLQ